MSLFVLIVVFLVVVPAAVIAVTAVDAATRPIWAWQFAQQRKVLWMTLLLLGVAEPFPAGITLAAVYLCVVRPKVMTAQLSALPPVDMETPLRPAEPPVWPRARRATPPQPVVVTMRPPVPLPPPMVLSIAPPPIALGPPVPPVAPPVPVAAGWYPDPYRDRALRFWNGEAWTKAVRRSRDDEAAACPPPRNGTGGPAAGVRTKIIDSNTTQVD